MLFFFSFFLFKIVYYLFKEIFSCNNATFRAIFFYTQVNKETLYSKLLEELSLLMTDQVYI